MFNLTKNELIKIFSKKGIYIVLIIFAIITILGVTFNKVMENFEAEYSYVEETLKYQKEYLDTINIKTEEGKYEYAITKAQIEYLELMKKYGEYSWQATIISDKLNNLIFDINYYEQGLNSYVTNSEKTKQELENQYNNIIERLDNNDWKTFAQEDLDQLNSNKQYLETALKNANDTKTIKELKLQLEIINIDIQVQEWRLKKDICYGDKNFENTLNRYEAEGKEIINTNYHYEINQSNYKEKESADFRYTQKKMYQNSLEEFNIAKYKIENNIKESNDTPSIIKSYFESTGILFIIIVSLMISGTIVSEEFNKGTIKLLLVRPYSRRKILLAKIIACFIAIIISTLAIMLIEIIILGIGFGNIDVPILIYNFNTNTVMEMNILKYILIEFINIFPEIIILTLISLLFGTVLTNSATAIVISILTYMLSSLVITLAETLEKQWLKIIPMLNWDLTQYLYGRLPKIEGMTITFSILVCIITIAIILVIAFENFTRKNIKNI